MTNPNALAVPTRTIQLVRHGATRLNNDDVSVDRIRGWKDIPLSPDGKKEAERIGREIAKNPPDFIASSDLERAYDTAKAIADACDMAVGDVTKGFRPWNLGDFAGQLSKEAVPKIALFACTKPDKKIPGGESFNSFKARFFAALANVIRTHDGVVAIVTHHRGERLIKAWIKEGCPVSGDIDLKVFTKKGEATGSQERIALPVAKVYAAAKMAERAAR